MGDRVFNGLAHFIKGGIFFLYGILTLGRWLGAFADLGWVGLALCFFIRQMTMLRDVVHRKNHVLTGRAA